MVCFLIFRQKVQQVKVQDTIRFILHAEDAEEKLSIFKRKHAVHVDILVLKLEDMMDGAVK